MDKKLEKVGKKLERLGEKQDDMRVAIEGLKGAVAQIPTIQQMTAMGRVSEQEKK